MHLPLRCAHIVHRCFVMLLFVAVGMFTAHGFAQSDLVITQVTWSPPTPSHGDITTFRAVVQNQGIEATPTDASIGVSFLVDNMLVCWGSVETGIEPNSSIEVVASGGPNGVATWTAIQGSHRMVGFVDDQNRITEGNEENNSTEVSLTVAAPPPPKPDLVITSITWTPKNPAPGDLVRFSAVVKNQGNAPTASATWLGVPFWVDRTVVSWGVLQTGSIAPNSSVQVIASGGPNGSSVWRATRGAHNVLGLADDQNRIAESNETNNRLELPFQVLDPIVQRPDLVITNISWTPQNPLPGDRVRFTATVKNQGTAATSTSTWLGVPFFVNNGVVAWGIVSRGEILPNNTVQVTATGGPNGLSTWPASLGSHQIMALADDQNRILESIENNNTFSTTLVIGAPTPEMGKWSPVYKLVPPNYDYDLLHRGFFVPIHLTTLPSGKLLGWSRDADGTDDYAPCEPSVSFIWDPNNPTVAATPMNPKTMNIGMIDCLFCAAHSYLPDGRLLVVGGHTALGAGLNATYIFDPANNTWTKTNQKMNAGRWYPTTITLLDGRVLVVGGTDEYGYNSLNRVVQVWETNATTPHWRTLSGITLPIGYAYYPWLFPIPNGKVFWAGPSPSTGYIDPAGTGSYPANGWVTRTRHNLLREYGTAVQYEPGKILIVGGATSAESGIPTATAEIIDLNSPTPEWRYTGSMAFARIQSTATILPDGTVLITGGTSGPANNQGQRVLAAELWNPQTGTFTTMANAQVPRLYHSTAVLLADGTVAVGGGGLFPNGPIVTAPPYDISGAHPTMEIFSPPYLKKGTRPIITSAPSSLTYGQSFEIQTPNASTTAHVTMVRLSSTTHSFNMNQHFARLVFAASEGLLAITAPTNDLAPPGDYYLYVINRDGVPSLGQIVKIR